MDVTITQAYTMLCPIVSTSESVTYCEGRGCMLWQFNEPITDGPDSYVSKPAPLGHCGLEQINPLNWK